MSKTERIEALESALRDLSERHRALVVRVERGEQEDVARRVGRAESRISTLEASTATVHRVAELEERVGKLVAELETSLRWAKRWKRLAQERHHLCVECMQDGDTHPSRASVCDGHFADMRDQRNHYEEADRRLERADHLILQVRRGKDPEAIAAAVEAYVESMTDD